MASFSCYYQIVQKLPEDQTKDITKTNDVIGSDEDEFQDARENLLSPPVNNRRRQSASESDSTRSNSIEIRPSSQPTSCTNSNLEKKRITPDKIEIRTVDIKNEKFFMHDNRKETDSDSESNSACSFSVLPLSDVSGHSGKAKNVSNILEQLLSNSRMDRVATKTGSNQVMVIDNGKLSKIGQNRVTTTKATKWGHDKFENKKQKPYKSLEEEEKVTTVVKETQKEPEKPKKNRRQLHREKKRAEIALQKQNNENNVPDIKPPKQESPIKTVEKVVEEDESHLSEIEKVKKLIEAKQKAIQSRKQELVKALLPREDIANEQDLWRRAVPIVIHGDGVPVGRQSLDALSISGF